MNFRGLAMLMAALILTSCDAHTLASGPIDGRVVDPETKQPIAGAIVVGKWGRAEGLITDNVNVCRHVATAVTDADGRYHLDQWPLGSGAGDSLFGASFSVELAAYKPGMASISRGVIKTDEMTGALELAPWSGTHRDRVRWLDATLTSTELTCNGDTGADEVLKAVRETIDSEATSIATTASPSN